MFTHEIRTSRVVKPQLSRQSNEENMTNLLQLSATLRNAVEDLLLPRKQSLLDGEPMGLLAEEHAQHHVNGRTIARQGRRIWKSIGIVGLLTSCGGLLFSNRRAAILDPVAQKVAFIPQENHSLHVLLPTRMGAVETCRTVISGAALNYPNPWAISWYADVDDHLKDIGGDLAKLESIQAFFDIQDPERNNDTVMVLANPNSWFQARPEVLLKRYRTIQQERQHQSLRQNATRELYELRHMKERVVLSVEKKCLSKQGADCLPVQAADNTPRFISHSFVMGPVEELRLLYRDAVEEAKGLVEQDSIFDEHSIFARLFSSQQHVNSAPRNYSIALDLVDRLSFTATSEMSYDSQRASTESGLTFWKHQTQPLTEDIVISERPFKSVSGIPHPSWPDLSFLIPKEAATVPAIVQNSREIDDNLAQTWYSRLWFHPNARQIVTSYASSSKVPVASFVDADGVRQRYHSPHLGGLGAVAANNEVHSWSEICEGQDFTKDLFVAGFGT